MFLLLVVTRIGHLCSCAPSNQLFEPFLPYLKYTIRTHRDLNITQISIISFSRPPLDQFRNVKQKQQFSNIIDWSWQKPFLLQSLFNENENEQVTSFTSLCSSFKSVSHDRFQRFQLLLLRIICACSIINYAKWQYRKISHKTIHKKIWNSVHCRARNVCISKNKNWKFKDIAYGRLRRHHFRRHLWSGTVPRWLFPQTENVFGGNCTGLFWSGKTAQKSV